MIDALDELISDSVISAVKVEPFLPMPSFGDATDPIDDDDELERTAHGDNDRIPDFVTPAFGGAPSNVRRRSRTPTLEV